MKIIPSRPNMAFSKVPHSITFSELLTAHQKMVWIMLDATCYNRETEVVSAAQLAKKLGLPARGLQRTIQELITLGLITKNGDVYSLQVEPGEEAEPASVKKERRLTRDEKLRLELRDIWNKYKPKNAPSMQDFTPARLKTLRIYVERFRADEQVVLRRVCDGSNADEFRRDKAWDFSNIFGNGVPTEDKQTKVEKVYKLGCSQKGHAASFDRDDKQCWLDWFASKDRKLDTVEFLVVESNYQARMHEIDEADENTLYVYRDNDGDVVHWTYKESQCGLTYLPTAS